MKQTKKKAAFDPNAFLSKGNEGRAVSDYAADQTIYSQGDSAVSIFYILSGKVGTRRDLGERQGSGCRYSGAR